MGDPVFWHRLQFGFTASFHYIFPQLTMGLALFIAVFKYLGLRKVAREEIFAGLMKPVVEEARLLASEIMASEHDIETAVKLALNWP